MVLALGIVGGVVVGAASGAWIAERQPDGWALIAPLGAIGAVIGAVLGGALALALR